MPKWLGAHMRPSFGFIMHPVARYLHTSSSRWEKKLSSRITVDVGRNHMLHQQLLFRFHRGLLFLRRHSLPYVGKEFPVGSHVHFGGLRHFAMAVVHRDLRVGHAHLRASLLYGELLCSHSLAIDEDAKAAGIPYFAAAAFAVFLLGQGETEKAHTKKY